ncbi:hypothetical protein ALC60_06478 [Trachymyrmex zeteki]|uniref:THAP-type domain-containing protein n=1 Tax=Mycetomoellerius zeteki TaxID=64791 RepID=A0A151X2M5_9HYME|nr:hypothetical protein ALC60_06478 [Trachymyrmex zeteki]
MKCIVVGCTSEYKSNLEREREESIAKERLLRNDIILNSSHCFCEKHFSVNDIVWKKLFYNKDGEIIQEAGNKKSILNMLCLCLRT